MKKFWMALLVVFVGATLGMSNVEAKRMGGGGSFGKSSPSASRQAPAQNNQAAQAGRPGQPAAAPSSPWRGIIGGALLGLGLGALFSHFGMGGELASMLSTMLMVGLLAFAAMFLYRMFTRKTANQNPQPAFAGVSEKNITPEIGANVGTGQQSSFQSGAQQSSVPADFDTAGFLRHAKINFLRMQAAWDKADTQDIREFTTPEMFAELKMQLSELNGAVNHTDVVNMEAELLGIDTTEHEHLASVRFFGMIRESEKGAPEAFNEIWVLSKPVTGNSGWMLAGLQQA